MPPAPYTARASGNDDIVRARARLGENLDTEYLFESDLLVISYDHYYPDQAAAGLEFAVQRLRAKMHALTIERVRRRKIFLDERLGEVRQDRTEAQDALTEFQQEFGVINLAAQSESAIQNVTALKTELYRKEVELHSQIELLGENTAAVVRLRSAVDQLRTLIREIEHGFVEFQDSAIPLQELSSFRASTSCCAAPRDGEGPITLPTALPAAASELRAGLPAPVPVRLVLPFFPGMTAYDALYAVGGPTPFARAEDSYLVRSGERIELDAAALWDGNTLTGDIPLQPRDQLVVPATEVFVTVLGEVNRPGVVPFQFGLTVSDYLLRSGGITREADAGLIHFVDKTGRSIRAAKLDAPVRSGDILIVERQVILRLLEGLQRIAPIVSLFNNTATAINTVSDWIDPSE